MNHGEHGGHSETREQINTHERATENSRLKYFASRRARRVRRG
jgi:hypothetical protein